MAKEKGLTILLVDDDAIDRELFVDAINATGGNNIVHEAANGEKALEFLQQCTRMPDLVILDLNMPVKDGRDTLKEIKKDPVLKSMPVCILSTSSAHFDIQYAYSEGANLFLVKPMDYKELVGMISSLLGLFIKYVSLVPRSTG